jgi:hypothetical protein
MTDAGEKLVETVARAVGLDIDIAPGHERCLDCLEERDDQIRQAEHILRTIEAAGYRIVPVEPTEEMSDTGKYAMKGSSDERYEHQRALIVWSSMLAAAPKVVS